MADGKKLGPTGKQRAGRVAQRAIIKGVRGGKKKIKTATTARCKGCLGTSLTAQAQWGRGRVVPLGNGTPLSALFLVLTVNLLYHC